MAPLKDKSQKDNKHLLLVDDDPNLVLLVIGLWIKNNC